MFVVKIGGSLLELPKLETVLRQIKQQDLPIVLLPGGGKFADIVRQEQKQYGFSDKAAHKMAIQAMQQYAELLHDISDIDFFDSKKNILRPAIFPPLELLSYQWRIPENWTVTSDSLAVLLAEELNAEKCMLLKACEIIDTDVQSLLRQGIIDEYAPIAMEQYNGEIQIVGIEQLKFTKKSLFQ